MSFHQPAGSETLIRSVKKIEALEKQARDLARSVETVRQQTLSHSNEKIVALEQKARDLASFVETTRQQTLLQSEKKTEALEQKARDLADFVETLRDQTRLQSETEIEALGQKARDLALFVETVRKETRLQSETEIAALGQKARDLAVSVETESKCLEEHSRRAEEAVRHSEARKDAILRGSLDAIITMDHEGVILSFNPSAQRIFGYLEKEAIGKSVEQLLVPPALRSQHKEGLVNSLKTGKGLILDKRMEMPGLRADGSVFPAELTITQIPEDGAPLFTVFLQDISDRRCLEEQFRQSQKMEALGHLAAGVAHDFNNLLTVILCYADVRLGNMATADPNREAMVQIHKAGERAADLTRQLLAFGRKQILSPVVVDLNSLLTETEKMLRRLIGAHIELTTILEPDLGRVKVDPGQVEQILMNLAVNASHAMSAGGRLTIQTYNTVLSDSQVRQHAELPPGLYTLLAVSDTGSGMDEATKARIFEPFFTTKEVGKGTGLGLATAFGIIKQSGGFLEVDSTLGSGSTFRIYLPHIREGIGLEEADHGLVKMPSGGETILLVEDEDGVREFAQLVLEASGYNVLSTRNGGEAVQVCHDYAHVIQLLFTDLVMPKISGRQLTDLLASSRPTMKVLYMSGHTDDTIVRHAIQGATTNFLSKPFTPVALAQKVREVLDRTNGKEDIALARSCTPAAGPVCVL